MVAFHKIFTILVHPCRCLSVAVSLYTLQTTHSHSPTPTHTHIRIQTHYSGAATFVDNIVFLIVVVGAVDFTSTIAAQLSSLKLLKFVPRPLRRT